MGRRRKNTFAKALGQLKSTKIDEKLQMLSERPTNSVMTYMTTTPSTLNPDFVSSQRGQDSALQFIQPDFDQDDPDQNGQDTTGLFEADGTPRTALPPGDTSYILGPMSAMWYGWANQTRIGYIREADRKMVNLGSITGTLDAWDGASNFTSYGQLTLEQAVWFKDVEKAPGQSNDPTTYNYRAFYPGPPSTTKDSFGRYYCVITGKAKSNPLSGVGEKEQIPGAGGKATADDNFSALLDRLKNFGKNVGKNIWDLLSGETGDIQNTTWGKLGGSILRSIMDPITYAGDYVFKGLPSGTPYNPAFTGGGHKLWGLNPKGLKITDMLGGLFGKNVQYFTPDLDTAIKYAGEGGNIVVMPKPNSGVRGMKNWLGSTVSRGFDPRRGVETIVSTTDSIAQRNLTKIINLSKAPNAQKNLQKLAQKGATNSKVLKTLGKAVPFLNYGLVTADVSTRLAKGDYLGAVMGGIQLIPGPVGWGALGMQVLHDTNAIEKVGGFAIDQYYKRQANKRLGEAVEESSSLNLREMRSALIEMGLPKDKNDFIKEMGFYWMLEDQMDPNMLAIILKAMQGEDLSSEQKKWVDDNLMVMLNGIVNYDPEEDRESSPNNPLPTEEDPWALRKQQTQESLELSESRKISILKNLKNPVVIPETKQKSYKVKPKIRGLNSAVISKPVETPKEYQPKGGRNLWGQYEYNRNVKQSQERKNEVLDLVGEGEQAFKYMLNDSRAMNAQQLEKFWGLHPELYSYFYNGKKFKAIRKEALDGDFLVFLVDENGVKSNILQSELNEKLVEDEDRKALEEYNKLNPKPKRNDRISFEKDYLFKKAYQKLKKEVDYDDKPARMGYPNDPPPKMVNGRHPDFGKRPGTTMFNKLDPSTAAATPKQDDPTIDAKVEKAKNNPDKDGSNWRKELEVKIKKHRQSIK